ncbi:MAG: hypothetical protein AAFP90_16220 [Planctomycetota bacterium]
MALLLVSAVSAGLGCTSARADWHSFWHNFHLQRHRVNAWPQPFSHAAAVQTAAPFEVMKQNGWRAHNTLGHELFRPADGVLLAAGRKRIEWIARHAPVQRRVVYVLQGENQEETQDRVENVRQLIAKMEVTGVQPQVLVTDIQPRSTSGARISIINNQAANSMVAPALPNATSGGAGISSNLGNAGVTSNNQ